MTLSEQYLRGARRVLEGGFGFYMAADADAEHAILNMIADCSDEAPAWWPMEIRCLALCLAAAIADDPPEMAHRKGT